MLKSINEKHYVISEVKGFIALIYHAVMRLEEAYKTGNQQEKHCQLNRFNQYKQFFVGQVENNNFTVPEKIKLYNEMYEVCLQILHHQRAYYVMTPIIIKSTHHYLVRIMERIDQLLEALKEIEHIEQVLLEKQLLLERLCKLRHHYDLVLNGVDKTKQQLEVQIKRMKEKLEALK